MRVPGRVSGMAKVRHWTPRPVSGFLQKDRSYSYAARIGTTRAQYGEMLGCIIPLFVKSSVISRICIRVYRGIFEVYLNCVPVVYSSFDVPSSTYKGKQINRLTLS